MRQSREDENDGGREIGLDVDVVRNYGKRLTQFSAGTRAGAGCAFVLSPTHFQTWYTDHINLTETIC